MAGHHVHARERVGGVPSQLLDLTVPKVLNDPLLFHNVTLVLRVVRQTQLWKQAKTMKTNMRDKDDRDLQQYLKENYHLELQNHKQRGAAIVRDNVIT